MEKGEIFYLNLNIKNNKIVCFFFAPACGGFVPSASLTASGEVTPP